MDLNDDALGILGLNYASRAGGPGELNMHPICGVRIQSLERNLAEITGRKFHQYVPPTVSEPLRYLVPIESRMDWILTREDPETNDEVIADILASLNAYGLPYMRKRVTLETMSQALVAKEGHRWQTVFRAPVALWLLNRHEEALSAMEVQLAEIGSQENAAYDNYRAFSAALKRRIAESAAQP
ncbi:hypothetical protein [Arthrobacter sp. HY1533]|uniref:hypothetical protein n=1 Tax=Arthrobacter sp. HY1533 TaxID=2970919 RepID=UPI0022B9E86F|nr:hypothetical protein [Arthrobacter sp. HY1533]